jgi:tetratricopeptide (TPR) repeat protein
MFGLFGKKAGKPTVTPEDKDWIEKNLIWFVEAFGLQGLKEGPFILPTKENFPYSDLKDPDQFQKLYEHLCRYWDLDPNEIILKFFDDFKSKQWSSYSPHEKINEPAGFYYQAYTTDEKRFNIHLAKSNLENPQLLIAVMAHELAHVKLLVGNIIRSNDPDMEPMTDLACIYFGFWLFVANTCETRDSTWIGRSGYLPNEVISYANALLCYVSGKPAQNFVQYLNVNTRSLFLHDYNFLISTNDTALSTDKLQECNRLYKIFRQMDDGFKEQSFNKVIEASKQLLEIRPDDNAAYNNWGYALLLQKNYKAAIEVFTRAIDANPHFDYPYNNRGYCKLQLDDVENALADIHTAFEMNPHNAYAWRNIGAYYLKTNDFGQALRHFEEAEKIDPETALINFYLAKAHLHIGNQEKAKRYLDRSKTLDEHNDSMIE